MGTGHSSRRISFDASGEVNFDHFQILRAIGKGSFGKVCIVQKKDTKRMFAMKYMNKPMCARQSAINNVVRELTLLTRLEHPFIVNLWYAFQDEEDMFMVVDLLLGGDLRYHMQQEVIFTEEIIRFYLCELALALDYLHSQRVLHRDIKPDNILLDEKGHCHVTDFNIATQLENDEQATSMSGTRPYMAPELYAVSQSARRGYSFAVDWWSLGVSLFELLKRRRPFNIHTNTTAEETLAMMAETKGKPLNISHASDEMSDVLRALLEFEPENRLQSVAKLKEFRLVGNINFDAIYEKKVIPPFVPSSEHLNCDPTYELEEMIIETKPLHKKKKRLAKQVSRHSQEGVDSTCCHFCSAKDDSTSNYMHGDEKEDEMTKLTKTFVYYNRDVSKIKRITTPPALHTRGLRPVPLHHKESPNSSGGTKLLSFISSSTGSKNETEASHATCPLHRTESNEHLKTFDPSTSVKVNDRSAGLSGCQSSNIDNPVLLNHTDYNSTAEPTGQGVVYSQQQPKLSNREGS